MPNYKRLILGRLRQRDGLSTAPTEAASEVSTRGVVLSFDLIAHGVWYPADGDDVLFVGRLRGALEYSSLQLGCRECGLLGQDPCCKCC